MKDAKAFKKIMHYMDQFERLVIAPSEFSWKYFEKLTGKNRSTLWRDAEVKARYLAVKTIIDEANSASDPFLPLQKKRATDQQRIRKLEAKVAELESKLEFAQERLVEMQAVMMSRGIDPTFMLEKRLQKHPQE